nr:zinc finger, CCHC-type [Tanacetum cinerariifolium]
MVNSMLSYLGLSQGFWGEAMLTACYLLNRVSNKRNKITPYELWTKKKPNLNYLRVWGCREIVRLPDLKLKTLSERGIKCIFVGYVEHSRNFRFYVTEPNESVAINFIIESRDAIFDENRFSSVPRPSKRSLVNETKDSGGSVVTDEVVQQTEPELKKSKRHRTPKDFRPEFQLYLIEGTRDEVSDQHSYFFNVEDDPKTFDKAIKPLGCKWIFKRKLKVDGTVEKFKARLVIHGFKQKSRIDYFDTYAPVIRISTIRLLIAMTLIHSLIIHQMDVKTAFLNDELDDEDIGEANVILGIRIKHESNRIAISQSHYIEKILKKFNYFNSTPVSTPMDTSEKLMSNNGKVVSQLKYTSNLSTQHWQAFLRVLKYLKKTMDYRLMYIGYPSVLEAAGKEAEWLKNLLPEIPLLVKLITPISIRCDNAATLAKAYSQMYNEKSRHLGVRQSMIRELITNRVVSIEFVRSQQNLADH